jgi:hypothetical protein
VFISSSYTHSIDDRNLMWQEGYTRVRVRQGYTRNRFSMTILVITKWFCDKSCIINSVYEEHINTWGGSNGQKLVEILTIKVCLTWRHVTSHWTSLIILYESYQGTTISFGMQPAILPYKPCHFYNSWLTYKNGVGSTCGFLPLFYVALVLHVRKIAGWHPHSLATTLQLSWR